MPSRNNPWADDEIQFIITQLREDPSSSSREVWDQLNNLNEEYGVPLRSYNSVQKKVKQLREALGSRDTLLLEEDSEEDLEDDNDDVVVLAQSDSSEVVLSRVVPSPHKVKVENRKAAEFIRSLADMPYEEPSIQPVDSEQSSLVILLSDLHFGKHTKSFNLEVAHQRISNIPMKLLESDFPLENIDEIVVLIDGDIVEGEDIYASQGTHLECSVIEQAQAAATALWIMLRGLRETFDVPVRAETAPGNHGRMSRTANEKSNWDNVVSMMLGHTAQMYGDPELTVKVNFDQMCVFEVKDKRGLLYHHGTKHLGTPAMKVKFAGWILSQNVDHAVHGHWHHWGVETYMGRPFIHNGSLCGSDDLSERIAEDEPPRQTIYLVTPGEPIKTFSYLQW